ncbi:MAG: GntR family transcriptional regulator [Phycisphaerae bacterium]
MVATLGKKIAQQIKEHISSGIYPPTSDLESERDLCLKYRVSRKTIRKTLAILEQDGLIKRLPRQGAVVTDQANKLLKRTSTKHALMFIRWSNYRLETCLAKGILQMAQQYEDQPVLVDARCSHQRFLDAIYHPPEGVKGLLLMAFNHPSYEEAVNKANQQGLKIIFLDRILPSFDFISSVTADNFSGAYQVTDHLINTHNLPVYHIGFTDQPSSAHDRYLGWIEAMETHGFRNWNEYLLDIKIEEYKSSEYPQTSWEEGYKLSKRVFQSKSEDKFCFFVVNDVLAEGVYRAAQECGMTVGRNVFMVGFDDLPFCKRLDPPLSSVYQPIEQIGFEGAKLLYGELNNNLSGPIHKVLPVSLKVRESCTGKIQ